MPASRLGAEKVPPDVAVRLSMVSVLTEQTRFFTESVPTLLTGNFSLGLVPVEVTLTLRSCSFSNGTVSVLEDTIFGRFPVDVPAQKMEEIHHTVRVAVSIHRV